jgi:transglutaminase-like putative cysteine protease/DNA-binding beta-propeller fold protein YncE
MHRKIIFCLILSLFVIPVTGVSAYTGEVDTFFTTPGPCPTGLVFCGKNLWVADRKTDSIYAVNPEDGSVTKTISAPGYQPVGLAWDGKYLWCLDNEENLIFKIDPQTGIALKTISAPSSSPKALTWDGKFLWVADNSAREINKISTEDGTTITTIPAPSSDAQGLAFDGKYLWVSDRMSNRIYMVTPDKGEVILFFDSPGPYARGLAWDGKNLWNVDYQTDKIYKIKIGDKDKLSCTNERLEALEYTNQVRNYGPGTLEELDIYLAIPQDLDNQKIIGKIEFMPEPTDILTDRWGQKVAHYHYTGVKATEFITVGMKVKAKLNSTKYFIFPEKVGSLKEIPKEIKEKYLVDDTKYSLSDPFIQKSAAEAVGDEKNPYWIARKIYGYINDRMRYELSGGWNIAPTVLKRGTGSCSEYSFVFIALCRAAGIPARYQGSVAIRGDDASTDDVFHRWCEVYLPNYGWIPVDPSGGDQPSPEAQAAYFGNLANRYLITTVGGGGSEYLEWNYNSNETWTSSGKCKVYAEHIGEWSPLTEGQLSEQEKIESSKTCQPKK